MAQLTARALEAVGACQMHLRALPTAEWALFPVPARAPQPLQVYVGVRPPGTQDGYDFVSWARGLGFRPEPSLGEWPFTAVTLEPAPRGRPVTVLAYLEGTSTLTIWACLAQARLSLPIAFPGPESG